MECKVTINGRGVITIPARLRQAFALEANDELILEETDLGILLRPAISVPIDAISVPIEMYTEERIKEFAADEPDIEKLLSRISKQPSTGE